jgi:hypothetical protein
VIWELVGTHLLEIVKPGVFGLTDFSIALAEPNIATTIELYFEIQGHVYFKLPNFVESINFQNPDDVHNSFTNTFGAPIWEWLKANPASERLISVVMRAYALNRSAVSEIYPTEKLFQNARDDTIIFVDIGGSIGHDTTSFAKAHSSKPGKLILQDRQAVIDSIDNLDPAIDKQAYDFFTPQPVKGAAAYYL